MSFPPFILPCLSFDHALTRVYLHSQNPYFHSISRTLCNKSAYVMTWSAQDIYSLPKEGGNNITAIVNEVLIVWKRILH